MLSKRLGRAREKRALQRLASDSTNRFHVCGRWSASCDKNYKIRFSQRTVLNLVFPFWKIPLGHKSKDCRRHAHSPVICKKEEPGRESGMCAAGEAVPAPGLWGGQRRGRRKRPDPRPPPTSAPHDIRGRPSEPPGLVRCPRLSLGASCPF